MEAVDVLGDHSGQPVGVGESLDGFVPGVGSHRGAGAPQLTVEVHLPAPHSELGTRPIAIDMEVVGVHFAPQAVRPAEIGDSRLGRDPGTGENQDLCCWAQDGDGRFDVGGCVGHEENYPVIASSSPIARRNRCEPASGPAYDSLVTTSEVQAWLDRYIEAWQKNDPELVEALFTSDAVYRFRPYGGEGRVAEGIADIVNSWIDFDEDPAKWEASYRPYAVEGDRAVAIGTSRYFGAGDRGRRGVSQLLPAPVRRGPLRRVHRVLDARAERELTRDVRSPIGDDAKGLGSRGRARLAQDPPLPHLHLRVRVRGRRRASLRHRLWRGDSGAGRGRGVHLHPNGPPEPGHSREPARRVGRGGGSAPLLQRDLCRVHHVPDPRQTRRPDPAQHTPVRGYEHNALQSAGASWLRDGRLRPGCITG